MNKKLIIIDVYDIFYSTLNKGWIEFTFYCRVEYTTCLEDIESLSNDKVLLSDINNFVSPFYQIYSSSFELLYIL